MGSFYHFREVTHGELISHVIGDVVEPQNINIVTPKYLVSRLFFGVDACTTQCEMIVVNRLNWQNCDFGISQGSVVTVS